MTSRPTYPCDEPSRRGRAASALLLMLGILASTQGLLADTKRVPGEPTRILLIHGGSLVTPGTAHADLATREALQAALPQPLQIDSEGISDLRSAGGGGHEKAFVELLLQRYGEQPPHLIIGHASAVPVIARNRNKLWPGTPLLFANVSTQRLRDGNIPNDVPAAFGDVDYAGTFQLALQLQPKASKAILIYGTTSYEAFWGPLALNAMRQAKSKISIETLVGYSQDELLSFARDWTPDTIVLYLGTGSDRRGRSYVSAEVVEQLADLSPAPIYTAYDIQIGRGVLGGSVIRPKDESRLVGEMARRLLAGEAPSNIPNSPSPPPVCAIDWRSVKHWRIGTALIPNGCQILFREPSFVEQYWNQLFAATTSLVFILILSIGYFLQRKQRHAAEHEASRRSEELTHASRLASAGQLTASITHEMNQPLTAILSNAEVGAMLASLEHPPIEEIRQIFEDIRDADMRAAGFIRQLRDLLTKRPIVLEPVQINDVVSNTLRLLERAAKSNEVLVSTHLSESLPIVAGDKVHLQQVLLNLMVNAMEAMSELPPERRLILLHTKVEARGQVQVSVTDSGPGIPPDRSKRLFEPFYTTKPTGMGLGLSLVRTIVEAHDGRIWAECDGPGATFRFTIPVPARNRQPANGQLGTGRLARKNLVSIFPSGA